jgi:hypothetical protein
MASAVQCGTMQDATCMLSGMKLLVLVLRMARAQRIAGGAGVDEDALGQQRHRQRADIVKKGTERGIGEAAGPQHWLDERPLQLIERETIQNRRRRSGGDWRRCDVRHEGHSLSGDETLCHFE